MGSLPHMSRQLTSQSHGDENRFIEDHAQTAQKLAVVRAYLGVYGNIIASVGKPQFNNRDIFFVDTHAGAGMHASREHPDKLVAGTPLIACHEGVRLQRRYPGLRVHVRAMEKHPRWIAHLRQRVDPFLTAPTGSERVDVRLLPGDFADHVDNVIQEAEGRKAASLWVIDPFGIDLPFDTMSLLQVPRYGPEVIINLDLLGLWRVKGATDAADQEVEDVINQGPGPGAQATLNRLFGGGRWRQAIEPWRSFRENSFALASAYANLFGKFKHRTPYLLYSTRGQLRAMVHLCHSDTGFEKFKRAFEQSQEIGLLVGARLDHANKAHSGLRLWEAYRGQETSIARLYEEHVMPYDRSQIRSICFVAEEDGYGRFMDPATFEWFGDRRDVPKPAGEQTSLFG